MVGVQNFKFSGYMTVSGLCIEKMRIRKHTVPNHIWCHIHAKFRGLKSHLITSESHPRVTSGQNSEASHIRVSHPQSHPDKIQSLPGGHPTAGPHPLSTLGISHAASQIYDLPTGWPRACIQRYCSQRPPGGDGAAISGVHRHVGLLQERPGGIGADNGDIEIFPRKCQNQ